ncbi:MAG: glycosyltransferase family 2 protein [Candidatus Omnitrophica bacterium]|nr:glycosyltransferase family 2 protein [Candidatus Omnitrophota bacterium]
MNHETFFSVVIPVYNRETFIAKCLNSVLSQDFDDFEIIVVDDGSTDSTGSVIKDNFHDKRLRYFYHENKGVAAARNTGIRSSKGEFIAFLDSDDRWTADKLSKTVEYIDKYPLAKIFHTEETWFRRGALLGQKKKHKKPTGRVYRHALPLCCIGMSTAVVNRSVFDDIGFFDESFPACEDYDLWLRAANKYELILIPEALTIKEGGRPDQLSNSVWGLDRFRIKALEKMILSNILKPEDLELTILEFRNKCLIFAEGAANRGNVKSACDYRSLSVKYDGSL